MLGRIPPTRRPRGETKVVDLAKLERRKRDKHLASLKRLELEPREHQEVAEA